MVDVFKYVPDDPGDIEAKKRSLLAMSGDLVSASQEMRLAKGYLGYLGIEHVKYLKIKAMIRAVRRRCSPETQVEALTVMACGYKVLDDDKLRPGRRYHPYFIKREMEKFSFGKKLKLHPRIGTLVILT